jgi:hypothetical protein
MGRADAYTDDLGNEFPVTFRVMDYVDAFSRVSDNGLVAQVGYLAQDDDSIDPRVDNENFGKMICFHSRYNLGDKHHYSEPIDLMRSIAEDIDPDIDEKIEALNNDKYQELVNGGMAHYPAANIVDAEIDKLISSTINGSGAVMLPLYLLDHSGLSMSVSGFSDRWDSGQVGLIYATGKQIKEEFGDAEDAVERATNLLKGEVEMYDQHLRNEVYGVNIETFVNTGSVDEPEWEQEDIDSCWGYFGTKYAEEELKDQFDGALAGFNALAAQKGAEREAEEEAARIAGLARTYSFEIKENHDPNAGISFYGDTVSITVHSGDPGGELGDFIEHMRQALADWYDGPVTALDAENKPSGPKM